MDDPQTPTTDTTAKWRPLERIDRRIVGVLVEKAKTTPDNYPLTLNSLLNGANQKSNRFPQMQLDEDQGYDALERLRKLGAVAEVQGDGRAPKYRHLMYDWLSVDKFELAVMAELLLRGAQTLGELRGRAARMERIAGISELRPIIDSLSQKGLILNLTPPGRGCVVTHALYQEAELAKVRSEYGNNDAAQNASVAAPAPSPVHAATSAAASNELDGLRAELASLGKELREMIDQVRVDLDDVRSSLGIERE